MQISATIAILTGEIKAVLAEIVIKAVMAEIVIIVELP
jgi:hypothetical protein